MKLLEENTAQKLRGGYYTPTEITDFITDWAFSDKRKRTVLEPSCGDGAFLESFEDQLKFIKNCTAIELIEEEAVKATEKMKMHANIDIINNDFFDEFETKLQHNKLDRKSTRLNSSHVSISYAVFCLKKKKNENKTKYY